MGKDKNSKSFEIALSGISCAIAVAVLPLGIMTGVGSLTAAGYSVAVLAIMLPLSKQFFKGAFLAYAATCILTIVLGAAAKFCARKIADFRQGFYAVYQLIIFFTAKPVPFVQIKHFGLHPIANMLQLKFKINKWLALVVKALWFDATLIIGYYLVFHGLLGGSLLPAEVYEFVNKYIFLLIFTVGSVIFFVYDYLILRCNTVCSCISTIFCSVLREKSPTSVKVFMLFTNLLYSLRQNQFGRNERKRQTGVAFGEECCCAGTCECCAQGICEGLGSC